MLSDAMHAIEDAKYGVTVSIVAATADDQPQAAPRSIGNSSPIALSDACCLFDVMGDAATEGHAASISTQRRGLIWREASAVLARVARLPNATHDAPTVAFLSLKALADFGREFAESDHADSVRMRVSRMATQGGISATSRLAV